MSIIIRPTASLAKRMGIKLLPSEARSSGKLGDWYANDIVLGRKRYILCVSEYARLSLLLKAAPYANWPERLAPALKALLLKIGVPEKTVEAEIATMESHYMIAKTNSRSVLGSIRDYAFNLEAFELRGRLQEASAFDASLWLADMISLVLPLGTPKDTALAILSAKTATILDFPESFGGSTKSTLQ